MDTRGLARGWVRFLGETMKIPLKLQENGVCAIGYGKGHVCTIEVPADDSPIIVHTELMSLAGSFREPVYARALGFNLYGIETAGCTIALDSKADSLVLCASRGASSLDEKSFASLVGTVITTAVRLRSRLQMEDETRAEPSGGIESDMPYYALRV